MAATIITSILAGGTNSHATTSAEANAVASDFVNQGVVGSIANTAGVAPMTGGFAVNAQGTPAMYVDVTAGTAYISATPSGQVAQVLRAYMSSNSTSYSISSNSSGSTKYDWIYLSVDATKAGGTEDSAGDNVTSIYTSRSSSNTSDNGSPPTYGILLAIVTVANGASSITGANIQDKRSNAYIASTQTASSGWQTIPTSLTYAGNNGNKEFTVTTGSDISSQISPGMRLQVTRGTSAPTECMSFASASSQYASKSSPSGITFVGNFTTSAWIYLLSYPSATSAIIGRDSAGGSGSGWEFAVTSSGQLNLFYRNGSGSTNFNTYQSLPLNRWVHVAAAVTAATPTVAFYMNGALIPGTSSATAATSVVQASTNLQVGKGNNSTGYLNAYLSEVRVWSSAQTQANIQANMAINLTGSESNLVALFTGNGNFNDSTSNANNLSAQNSASATQAANPYNNAEYGIITAVSSTTLTVFCGTDYNIPNMTLSNPQFSQMKVPYGWPAGTDKWFVGSITIAFNAQSSPSSGVYYNLDGNQISIPIGPWRVYYEGSIYATRAGASTGNTNTALSTSNSSVSDPGLATVNRFTSQAGTGSSEFTGPVFREKPIRLSTQTIYYMIFMNDGPASSIEEGGPYFLIKAECAYA